MTFFFNIVERLKLSVRRSGWTRMPG